MEEKDRILEEARKEAERIVNEAKERARVIEESLSNTLENHQEYTQQLAEKGFKVRPGNTKWMPDMTYKHVCWEEKALKENLKQQKKMNLAPSVFALDWDYPYGDWAKGRGDTTMERAVFSCRTKIASMGVNYLNTMLANAQHNYLKWGQKKSLEYLMELKANIESQMDLFYARPKFSDRFMALKIEEVELRYKIDLRKQMLKDEMRKEKELAREEAKAQKEFERELRKAKADEDNARKALEKAQLEAAKEAANEKRFAKLQEQIAQLQAALKEAEERGQRILSMAQQTRRGWVYIISNIGSFGEGVYKIGLTRRLDPMERVYELGDASVPFPFDVHAFIFSEDAPALETALHQTFDRYKVNTVNWRKEYFKVPLEDIKAKVKELGYEVEFEDYAYAPQFRDSQSSDKQ